MTIGSQYLEVLSEIAFDGCSLCRRLDNQKLNGLLLNPFFSFRALNPLKQAALRFAQGYACGGGSSLVENSAGPESLPSSV